MIEPAAGADRAVLAFLCDAYDEDEIGGEHRTVLRLHPAIAPIKVAVFPLLRKDGHPELAREVYESLRGRFSAEYDDGGNIGKRYRRQDEIGTPFGGDDRPPVARGPHGHAARPRLARAGARGDRRTAVAAGRAPRRALDHPQARLLMAGWVALLRGINLGARNRIPMAGLKQCFEDFGAEDVRTYIVSGNVVFTHKRTRPRRPVEGPPEGDRGRVRRRHAGDPAHVQGDPRVAGSTPFGDDNAHTYVTFLAAKPKAADVKKLAELDAGDDTVKVVGSDMYLHLPNGLSKATLPLAKVDKTIGVPGTNRNWRTVAKLAEMTRDG